MVTAVRMRHRASEPDDLDQGDDRERPRDACHPARGVESGRCIACGTMPIATSDRPSGSGGGERPVRRWSQTASPTIPP